MIGSVVSYLTTEDLDLIEKGTFNNGSVIPDIHSYTIVGGADAAMFKIVGNELQLNTNQPDYENPNDADANGIYEIIIRTTDLTGKVFDKNVEISLVDITKEDTVLDSYKISKLDIAGNYTMSDTNLIEGCSTTKKPIYIKRYITRFR